MTVTGTSIPRPLFLYNASGAPEAFSSKAAMQAAGWDLTWYDATGTALVSQPAWTLTAAGVGGRHQLAYPMPSALWTCKITRPNLLATASPIEFGDEGLAYDTNTIGSIIATSSGVALTPVTVSKAADIYDGDSIVLDFSFSEAALSYIGAASLAAVTTILAQVKLNTSDSSVAATVTGFTNAITSDISGTRVVRCTLAAFPAALAVPTGTKTLSATAHCRLTGASKTAIGSEIALTIHWKATTA